MKKFLTTMLLGIFLSSGCSTEKPVSEPTNESQKNSVVEQSAPQSVEPTDEFPAKISVMPSIGATRAEWEKYHKKNAENGKGYVQYNNDEYLVTFLDFKTGNSTNAKNERAFTFILQAEESKTYNLEDFIPSDAQILKTNSGSVDNMIVKNVDWRSELIAQLYPKSQGYFFTSTYLDEKTNAFMMTTFLIEPSH